MKRCQQAAEVPRALKRRATCLPRMPSKGLRPPPRWQVKILAQGADVANPNAKRRAMRESQTLFLHSPNAPAEDLQYRQSRRAKQERPLQAIAMTAGFL